MHRVIWVPVFQVEPRKHNRRNSALKSSGADGDCEVKGSKKMKRDQHADTFEDEEAYVKILREVGLVEELDGRWRMGDIETLGSNKRCTDAEGRDHVCWTFPEMKTQESQVGLRRHAETGVA